MWLLQGKISVQIYVCVLKKMILIWISVHFYFRMSAGVRNKNFLFLMWSNYRKKSLTWARLIFIHDKWSASVLLTHFVSFVSDILKIFFNESWKTILPNVWLSNLVFEWIIFTLLFYSPHKLTFNLIHFSSTAKCVVNFNNVC